MAVVIILFLVFVIMGIFFIWKRELSDSRI